MLFRSKGLAQSFAGVIDKGIGVKAALVQVTGGYSYKETYGALVNITV